MSLLCTALQVDMLEHELTILHKNLALSFEFSHLESRMQIYLLENILVER